LIASFRVRADSILGAGPESIVDGQFHDIDEGNRLRRLVIGFGAGTSKLDTQVQIYQYNAGTPDQLLNFTTHAESGKMPGAAVTMGAGAAAQGGVTLAAGAASMGVAGAKTYRSSMGFLADSTAKQIVAYFSQYAAKQGWISHDQAEKGQIQRERAGRSNSAVNRAGTAGI
jgi:Domain of unknown function (DUF4410)